MDKYLIRQYYKNAIKSFENDLRCKSITDYFAIFCEKLSYQMAGKNVKNEDYTHFTNLFFIHLNGKALFFPYTGKMQGMSFYRYLNKAIDNAFDSFDLYDTINIF